MNQITHLLIGNRMDVSYHREVFFCPSYRKPVIVTYSSILLPVDKGRSMKKVTRAERCNFKNVCGVHDWSKCANEDLRKSLAIE